MAHLSLGSPIQLDDGSSFDHYKTQYDLSSPFPCSFSDADSSPSTQTSSLPGSSFLGYTPPTSDEEGDKDADGEFDTSYGASSPSEPFPSIVSPIPLPIASNTPFTLESATTTATTRQEEHSSQYASQVKTEQGFAFDDTYLYSHASLDSINSTLVAGSYLNVPQSCLSAPGGLIAPLCSAELDKLGYSNDAPRRDSDGTSLSFGSYSSSDYSETVAPSMPMPTVSSAQSITPTPSPTAGVDGYTSGTESQQIGTESQQTTYSISIPSDPITFSSYFPRPDSYHPCSFADCQWVGESKEALATHHGEHVRIGIFNCTSRDCTKHFANIISLETHQLVDHSFTGSPLIPQTSFTTEVHCEVDQYFPQMNTYDNTTPQNTVNVIQYEPYYQVPQSANDTVGLGFVQPTSAQVQQPVSSFNEVPASTMENAPAPASYTVQAIGLPRRASDSNIHTDANGHLSTVSWERSMPTLNENEVFNTTSIQQAVSLPMSQSASVCSSGTSTPQQSAQKQRRVAFSVPLPSPAASGEVISEVDYSQALPTTPAPALPLSYAPPPVQVDYARMHHADPHALAARFHAANVAYREGVYGVPQHMHSQMMGPGVYYPNMPNGTAGMVGHQVPQGIEEYFAAQQYANPHYLAQHVNLASIDPTMAVSPAYGYQGGEYHATSYAPTLINHIAHQRVARAALPRRGSESSYLASHNAAHAAGSHPYALALSAALASDSKQIILPDNLGPVRNKPARARVNLPGPKGQEIPKANRKGSTSADLSQGGYPAEEVEGINLAELKLHPCDFEGCCRVFKRLEHKRRHQRSHTQEKPYQCPVEGCKRFFSRSDNLTQHKRTHERNGRTQRLTLANLQQHCAPYGLISGSVPFEHLNQVHAA